MYFKLLHREAVGGAKVTIISCFAKDSCYKLHLALAAVCSLCGWREAKKRAILLRKSQIVRTFVRCNILYGGDLCTFERKNYL